MRWILLLIFIITAVSDCLWAQLDRDGAPGYEKRHPHMAMFETPFFNNDVALGATYRYTVHPGQMIGVTVSAYFRPFGKSILLKSAPHYYFQLKEYRHTFAVGLEKKFWVNNRLDVFVGGALGLSVVDYRGTGEGVYEGHQIVKKDGLTPIIKGGIAYKFTPFVYMRAGYLYTDMKTVDGHRIYFAIGGQL